MDFYTIALVMTVTYVILPISTLFANTFVCEVNNTDYASVHFTILSMDAHVNGFYILVIIYFDVGMSLLGDFSICHDNFNLELQDGIVPEHTFTWLGVVHYIHMTGNAEFTGTAPRVVQIHREFAIGTADSLINLPKHHKLGDITFGDYKQDEDSCKLSKTQAKMGMSCPRAYMIMPISLVLPHPEYYAFTVKDSVALVKFLRPLGSDYMVPLCMPNLVERKTLNNKPVFMADYVSNVPDDFAEEFMAKRTLKLRSASDCKRLHNMIDTGITHIFCTTGCSMRPGAPLVLHASNGLFELVGISSISKICVEETNRKAFNNPPAVWIDIYPFNTWIVNVITAHVMPLPYPNTLRLAQSNDGIGLTRAHLRQKKKEKARWRGGVYVVGNWCFEEEQTAKQLVFFYSELFTFKTNSTSDVTVILQVSVGIEATINCVRLMLPSKKVTPLVMGVGGFNISIFFQTDWAPSSFNFELTLTGLHSTKAFYDKWYNIRPKFWYWQN